MSKTPFNMRLDADLVARVKARADELGQTQTKFVERALHKALGDPVSTSTQEVALSLANATDVSDEVKSLGQALSESVVLRDDNGDVIPKSTFKCRSCSFSAPSETARCPHHGGKLVKA